MMIIFFVVLSFLPSHVFGAQDKNLNESCKTHSDCAIAYSYCNSDKKCVCQKDFYEKEGKCLTSASQCPYWDKPISNPKSCTAYRNETTSEYVHTCNDQREFCFIHPYVKSEDGKDVGSCCPKPPADARLTMACVVGAKHANGTCPDTSSVPADAPAPADKIRTCPYGTHECAWYNRNAACCPRPCLGLSSYFSVNGRCYDYVLIGDPCTHQAQCGGRSKCLKEKTSDRKTCQCLKGIIPGSAPSYCHE